MINFDLKKFNEFLQKKEKKQILADIAEILVKDINTEDILNPEFDENINKKFQAEIKLGKFTESDINEAQEILAQFLKESLTEFDHIPIWFLNMYDRLKEIEKEDILDGVKIASSDADPVEKTEFTFRIMHIIKDKIDDKEVKRILCSGIHPRPSELGEYLKEKYKEFKDIDKLLEFMHKLKLKMYETYEERDDKIYEYLENNKKMQAGVREGNKIYTQKRPLDFKGFFYGKTDKEKRYNFCHCPWIRDSIINEELNNDYEFCYCGAGWTKQLWDIILEQHVEMEMIKSVIKGDDVCEFAVILPDDVL